jgi:hypothetical protein
MSKIFDIGAIAMSPRYKIALLSLVSLAGIYAYYFARVASGITGQDAVRLLHVTIVTIAIVQIAGHAIIIGTSSDRYGPMDERERDIDRRATAIGYYLLLVCALAATATLHLGASPPQMANAVLLAVVVAECARQGIFLVLHHRKL